MNLTTHNGIDVDSPEDVDRAHANLTSVKEEYRIRQIHPVRHQHGVYSLGGNSREILANRKGGYSYAYDDPAATSPRGAILSWATSTT